MRIGWENLREGVPHLQLSVDGPVHESLTRIKTAIFTGTLGNWGTVIVTGLIRKTTLEVCWVSCIRRQVALINGILDNEGLSVTHGLIERHKLFGLGASPFRSI